MKKGLMNNWGLKILSFLLAVMLWLIVVNIDDPVTTQTFNNIPVVVTNAEVLAATNQTYQIEDGTQNVSVTVRAKRSVLNKIKADNIKATADMKELTLQTQIPISVEITGVNYESVEVSPRNLQVKLEDEETKKFPIVPKTTGTEMAIHLERFRQCRRWYLSGDRSLSLIPSVKLRHLSVCPDYLKTL